MWDTSTTSTEPIEPPHTPYGPYPCKAISKIYWEADEAEGLNWTVFAGGMPRASYGDKFTVTVMKGEEKHSVFDLTSKIVDFAVISENSSPSALVVLAEEELVTVDLSAETWPVTYNLPYLNPIHASSITCLTHVPNVKKEIFEKTKSEQMKVSSKSWPIDGGCHNDQKREELEVLVTGHEDGSVKFWNCGDISMSLLAIFKTSKYFLSDDIDAPRDDDEVDEDEDEWPPFKKIGQFDPYR